MIQTNRERIAKFINPLARNAAKGLAFASKESMCRDDSRAEGAARLTLCPGVRAEPGLVSVRGLDWPGPSRREGFIHVHQTHRHAAHDAERRCAAQRSLPRRRAEPESHRGAKDR